MSYYRLSDKELLFLLKARNQLYALHAYGVDNWDGYEEAVNDEEFEVTEDDFDSFEIMEE